MVPVVMLAAALWWLRRRWVLVTVDGPSMLPALAPGARVLAHRTTSVRTGDVVVADWPAGDRVIKRVAGAPGDRVPPGSVHDDAVGPGGRVPAGMLILLGDNTADSTDSRTRGYCPRTAVVAVVPRR